VRLQAARPLPSDPFAESIADALFHTPDRLGQHLLHRMRQSWPADLSDEQILERLLAINLERAAKLQDGFATRPSTNKTLRRPRPVRAITGRV
jgi:hypothetical protein